MSRANFYVSTDRDGKMPVLSAKPLKAAWVKYVNNVPVAARFYDGQDRVWDYSTNTMLAVNANTKDYLGKPMQLYKGEVHE